jgi:putative Holliday junction resolvase
MRTLAIDLGARRTGLALSDAGGKLATPFDVLQGPALERILEFIKSEDVQRIVVGLPLNMDGTRGPAVDQTIKFGQQLATRAGRKVIYVDERLSSFQAEQDVTARRRGGEKITRKAKRQRLDAIAAAQFLQEFLDGKLTAIEV